MVNFSMEITIGLIVVIIKNPFFTLIPSTVQVELISNGNVHNLQIDSTINWWELVVLSSFSLRNIFTISIKRNRREKNLDFYFFSFVCSVAAATAVVVFSNSFKSSSNSLLITIPNKPYVVVALFISNCVNDERRIFFNGIGCLCLCKCACDGFVSVFPSLSYPNKNVFPIEFWCAVLLFFPNWTQRAEFLMEFFCSIVTWCEHQIEFDWNVH